MKTRKTKTLRKNKDKRKYKKCMKGGLLGKSQVLSLIKSIGYEFESDYFIPLFKKTFNPNDNNIYKQNDQNYNYNEFINLNPTMNKNTYYGILSYSIDKTKISHIEDKEEFAVSYDIGGYIDNTFNNDVNAPYAIVNNKDEKFIVLNDPRTSIKNVSNIYETTPKYTFPDLEFHSTYYDLTRFNSEDVITETFKDSINKIYNFIMNPSSKEIVSIVSGNDTHGPYNLYSYGETLNLIQVLPDNYTRQLIDYARFTPQMTFSSGLSDSILVVKYLLENNFYTTNDPNSIQNIVLMNKTLEAFNVACNDGAELANNLSKLYYAIYKKKVNLSELTAVLTYFYYFEWCITVFEQNALDETNKSSWKYDIPDEVYEGVEYYKDIMIINIRHDMSDLLYTNFSSFFMTFLKDIIDNNFSQISDVNVKQLLTNISNCIYKNDQTPDNFITCMLSDKKFKPKFKDKFVVSQRFDTIKGVIFLEFRGFNIALNKLFKESHLNKAEVHNQTLLGDYSLDLLYKYSSGNANDYTRQTRKRKLSVI
jgi:hypothetical protein